MSKIYLRTHKLLIINNIQNRKILTFLRAENKFGDFDGHSREVVSDFLTIVKVTNRK